MKPSTEALINDAMEMNTSIQEDNLTMLEIKNSLCNKARSVRTYKNIANTIKKSGLDNMTMWLLDHAYDFSNTLNIQHDYNKPVTELMVKDILTKIDKYVDTTKKSIAMSLTNMVEASMKDLDKTEKFQKATHTPKVKFVAYNKTAVENLSVTLHNLFQEIGFMCTKNVSYKELRDTIKNDIDTNLHMLHTTISYEGYVSMNLPQPSLNYSSQMDWSVAGANMSSKYLNNITYEQMMNRLADLKLGIGSRINRSKNLVNDICCVHLIAQLIMSAKNTMMTMRNIHKATLNEASNEGFFNTFADEVRTDIVDNQDIGIKVLGLIRNIKTMDKFYTDRILNAPLKRYMSRADDMIKACQLLIPALQQIGQNIKGNFFDFLRPRDKDLLNMVYAQYFNQFKDAEEIIQYKLNIYKNSTLSTLGYNKDKLIKMLTFGSQVLNAIPQRLYVYIRNEAYAMDITYPVSTLVRCVKNEVRAILKAARM